MYGILTSLQAGRGSHLLPIAAPIALVPIRPGADEGLRFGRILPGADCFAAYRRHLAQVVEDEFALFLPVP